MVVLLWRAASVGNNETDEPELSNCHNCGIKNSKIFLTLRWTYLKIMEATYFLHQNQIDFGHNQNNTFISK